MRLLYYLYQTLTPTVPAVSGNPALCLAGVVSVLPRKEGKKKTSQLFQRKSNLEAEKPPLNWLQGLSRPWNQASAAALPPPEYTAAVLCNPNIMQKQIDSALHSGMQSTYDVRSQIKCCFQLEPPLFLLSFYSLAAFMRRVERLEIFTASPVQLGCSRCLLPPPPRRHLCAAAAGGKPGRASLQDSGERLRPSENGIRVIEQYKNG